MPASTTEVIQYGVRYQNGEEDWNTRSWFGHIESPEMRESFQEQYDLRMKKQFGVPPVKVTFLRRTVTTTIDEPVIIDDTAPAAPDTDAEPPTQDAPAEEESPVVPDNTPTKESNDTAG